MTKECINQSKMRKLVKKKKMDTNEMHRKGKKEIPDKTRKKE